MLDVKHLELTYLFPVPLMKYCWPDSEDLNKSLMELIRFKQKEDSGISTTNIGGWHSKKNLQQWSGENIKVLLCRIQVLGAAMLDRFTGCTDSELLSNWTVQAWANINRFGHYNEIHHHIRHLSLWSGVYYVSTGIAEMETAPEARVVFEDQHQVTPSGHDEFRKKFFVRPEPGLMLLFPSALAHSVEPHQGRGDRITIGFNLKNDRFTTLNYEMEKTRAAKPKAL